MSCDLQIVLAFVAGTLIANIHWAFLYWRHLQQDHGRD